MIKDQYKTFKGCKFRDFFLENWEINGIIPQSLEKVKSVKWLSTKMIYAISVQCFGVVRLTSKIRSVDFCRLLKYFYTWAISIV